MVTQPINTELRNQSGLERRSLLDSVDMKILKMLSADARVSFSEMGKEVGLSVSAVRKRVERLQKSGVVKGFTVALDPQKFGKGLTAFISVETDVSSMRDLIKSLSRRPEVCELYTTTGGHGLMMKIKTENVDELKGFVKNHLHSNDAIKSVRTTVAIETIKETLLNL